MGSSQQLEEEKMKKMEKVKMTPFLTLNPHATLSLRMIGRRRRRMKRKKGKERRPRQMWVKGFKGIRVSFLQINPLSLLISNLSQIKVHFFNGRSNEVKLNAKINVLNKIHAMTPRSRAYDSNWKKSVITKKPLTLPNRVKSVSTHLVKTPNTSNSAMRG